MTNFILLIFINLRKFFIFFVDYKGNKHPLQLVVYKFEGVPEHRVMIRPHGNAKTCNPYCRVMKSTKEKLREELEAIHKVTAARGGLVKSKSVGELSLNLQQAYNINHKRKLMSFEGVENTRGTGSDLLYIIMEQCKLTDREKRYIQEVICAPEPMAILATQQQCLT